MRPRAASREGPHNVLEAFRDTVHGYPDGVPALAAAIGMVPGTLYNKANINDTEYHKATLSDAALVILASGAPNLAEAFAAISGGVFVPLPALHGPCDAELLSITAQWMAEQGKFFREFDAAIADGKIDRRENAAMHKQAQKVLQGCLLLLQRVSSMAGDA